METFDLDAVEIPRDVLDLITPSAAYIYRIVPVRFDKDAEALVVATADPTNLAALEDLRFMLGCKVDSVKADEAAVSAAIERYYGGTAWLDKDIDGLVAECEAYRPFGLKALRRKVRRGCHGLASRVRALLPFRKAERGTELVDEPFVRLTFAIILKAAADEAPGIVLRLSESGGKVSFGHEKELREIRRFSPKVARLVMNQLKRMAETKRDPETGLDRGTIRLNLMRRDFECRVTGESVEDGERLCLRLIAEGGKDGPEETG